MFHSKNTGVTLVELLTVIVVLAVLASVAIPSYRSYMIRTQRTDAKTALMNVRAAQEKFYLQRNAYTAELTDDPPDGLGLRNTSENGLYTISIDLGTAADADSDQGYTVIATPVDGKGQTEDTKCLTMSLTDVGVRAITGSGDTDSCWR